MMKRVTNPIAAQQRTRRGVALGLPLMLVLASGARADGAAVPGATYSGVASDNASVTFTISSDGTLVDGYSITGATGQEPGGHTCDFVAGGRPGSWPGAPIDGNAFAYTLGSAIMFRGTFTGPQTAAGSFRLSDPQHGPDPACDTGVVDWTAGTTATPPGGTTDGGTTTGGTTGGGSGGGANSTSYKTPTYPTWVSLKKRSDERFAGSVRAASRMCIGRRSVYLMVGRRRVATVRTNARGNYQLRITSKLRKQRVRAAVPTRSTAGGICAAGSSRFITV